MKKILLFLVCCICLLGKGYSQAIIAGEYFIDTDPGMGNGTPIVVSLGDSVTSDFSISTDALSVGYHAFYVRYLYDNGEWGNTANTPFIVSNFNNRADSIIAGEYFIDTDPGVGNGIAIAITEGDSAASDLTISTSTLSFGYHSLYVRYRYNTGLWGNTANTIFNVTNSGNPADSIVAGEYFIDTDPGAGNGIAITVTGNDSVTSDFSIGTGTLSPGYHSFYVRYQYNTGEWGNTANSIFNVTNYAYRADTIVAGEYFIDTDPGAGNGIAISVTPGDSSSSDFSIGTETLSAGYHSFYVRYQYNTGEWGNTANTTFTVANYSNRADSIIAGEYFIDTDPGAGLGTPVTAIIAGDSVAQDFTIPTDGLSSGHHTVYFRYQYNNGTWGEEAGITFNLECSSIIMPAITGATTTVFVESSLYLTDLLAGGTWQSTNPEIATVDMSGLVTGISLGVDTISYTISNACSTAVATQTVSVNPDPTATISGSTNICYGSVATLTVNGTPNAGITLFPLGTFTLNSSGTATYTVSPASTTIYNIAIISVGSSTAAGTSSAMVDVTGAPGNGIITTFAGNGTIGDGGDGGPATDGGLNYPTGVAVDGLGNVYIADGNNNRVQKVNSSGIISTFAGNLTPGYFGDGGPATAAELNIPIRVAIDNIGNVYIACFGDNVIRMVNTSGIISTVAGMNGSGGYSGDGNAATAGELNEPWGIAVDASGNLYIADGGNNVIRKVATSGIIYTIAGNGTSGYSGDGDNATGAELNHPEDIAVDGIGNLYIADMSNSAIRKVNISGVISTIAGNDTSGYSGDGGPATAAELYYPTGVALDGLGNIYIADEANNRIRELNTAGIIITIAGNGTEGYSGDGGPATNAELSYYANDLAIDGNGNIFIVDEENFCIRKVTVPTISGVITGSSTVIAGSSITLSDTTSGGTWSVSNGNATINSTGIVAGISAGVDTIIYTVSSACGATTAIHSVTVIPTGITSATLTGTATICAGSIATLSVTGTPNAGITLSPTGSFTLNGSGVATFTVSPAATTTYSIALVSVGSSTATGSGSAAITVNAVPTATITGTQTITGGSVATLSVSGTANAAIALSPSGSFTLNGLGYATYTVSPVSTTIYTISSVIQGSCAEAGAGAATVRVMSLPTATITGTASICAGSVATLSVTGTANAIISLSPTGTFSLNTSGRGTYTVSPAATTTYSIALITAGTSTATGTGNAAITINAIPTASISGTQTIFIGASATLSVSGTANAAINLSPSGSFTLSGSGHATYTVSPASTTIYTISSVSLGSCAEAGAGAATVTVMSLPTATITGTASICTGSVATVSVTGTPNAGITLYPSGTFSLSSSGYATFAVSPAVTATYSIAVVSVGSSTAAGTGNAVITVNVMPTGTISGTQTIYIGAVASLSVSGTANAAITLSPSGSFTLNGSGYAAYTVSPSSTTIYTISSVSLGFCAEAGAGAATVTVMSLPTATITGTAALCAGSITTLSVTGTPNAGITLYPSGTFLLNGSGAGTYIVSPASTTIYSIAVVSVGSSTAVGTGSAVVSVSAPGIGSGIITTFSGNGSGGYTSDGGTATAAALNNPIGVAVDGSGNVFIADYFNQRVRKVNTSGVITTIAGTGTAGYNGDGIEATAAELNTPFGVTVDAGGNVYIADYSNQRIRKVNTSGIITTIAGNGIAGFSGDGLVATAAQLNDPQAIAIDGSGNIYIADNDNDRIRMVNTSGIINTIAGGGASYVEGEAATAASINTTACVAVDAGGNIYIASYYLNKIFIVNTSGFISTYAGTGVQGFSGDGDAATAAELNRPAGVSVDNSGNVYIVDYGNQLIREVNTSGIISTIAGNGTSGYSGDSNPATTAELLSPQGVAADGSGNVYIADAGNNRIRKVTNPTSAAGTITGASTVNTGSSISLSDITTGGTWSASNGYATVNSSGVVTGVSAGVDTIIYTVSSACGAATAIYSVTVIPTVIPSATITGTANICAGSVATLSITGTPNAGITLYPSGTFSLSGSGVGTYTVSPAVTTTYGIALVSVGSSTATGSGSAAVTVNTIVPTAIISGATAMCTGVNYSYSLVGTSGGSWSTASATIASVSPSGVVTTLAAGVNTVMYSVTNACGSAAASRVFTVNATPTTATISGASAICLASTATLTASIAGGTWSSSATTIASVSASGVVSGRTAGSAVIYYTPAGVCGYLSASAYPLTVNVAPPGILGGATSLCMAASGTVTATVSGGAWSMTNANATIAAGVVTGVSAGLDTVIYSVTNVCGTASVTRSITVNGSPTVAPIWVSSSTICLLGHVSYSDPTTGGIWSATPSSVLSIGSILVGVGVGTGTLSYHVTNSCGTTTVTAAMSVITTPTVSAISGNGPLCTGSTLVLSDVASGGTWLSNNTAVATVSGGVVTPVSTGTAVIVYSVTNACGSASTAVTTTVTATPVPSTISGTNTLCIAGTASLAAGTPGGTWASGSTGILTVSATGAVRGIAAGTGVVSYTLPANSCGAAQTATYSVTVLPNPTAGTISGTSAICDGTGALLTDGVSGGTWSSSNPSVASISGTGSVTAVAVGAATVIYAVTGACGSASTSYSVAVIPTPSAATISGATSVCVAGNTTLSASVAGGAWSSGTATVATISAAGVVHGLVLGTDVISYTLPVSSCSAALVSTYTVSINSTAPGTITGPTSLCIGSPVTYTITGAGGAGTWTTGNGNASVTPTGVVSGLAAGTSTVVFTVSDACGTTAVGKAVTIGGLPTVAPISLSAATMCKGTHVTFSDPTTGGVWTASPASVLSIGTILVGAGVGTGTISYHVTNSCGTTTVTAGVTVTSCTSREIEAAPNPSQGGETSEVRVFPNPSTGLLYIEASVKVDAKLTSIDGRLLIDQKDATQINMNNLANGIYFISVYDNATGLLVKTEKIVKN